MRTIPLTGGGEALVDDADYERLSRYRWHTIEANGKQYVSRMTRLSDGRWKRVLMHREVLHASTGTRVDHKNRDTFDNTRGNLRLATARQNGGNSKRNKRNTSGYRGVSLTRGAWVAFCCQEYLGRYRVIEAAARAYDAAAIRHFGVFAQLNFPLEGEAA